MNRCSTCDQPAPCLVSCGGDACKAMVGPCCLGATGLCVSCEVEETKAVEWLRQQRDERARMLIALLLSGAMIGEEQLPIFGDALAFVDMAGSATPMTANAGRCLW